MKFLKWPFGLKQGIKKVSGKRIKLFQMEVGREYAAFDGDRKLPKTYKLTAPGKLMNADELGDYIGCSWIPVKDSIRFVDLNELIAPPPVVPQLTSSEALAADSMYPEVPANIMSMIPGQTYVSKSDNKVYMKVNNDLFRVTKEVKLKKVQADKIMLSEQFVTIGL